MKISRLAILIVATVVLAFLIQTLQAATTPLDTFVAAADNSFGYSIWKTAKASGLTVMLFNVTSQTWLNETIVDHPKWSHYLLISVPDDLKVTDQALLLIQGGLMDEIPSMSDSLVTQTSTNTGSIVAGLFNIPTQRLLFRDDPLQKKRQEDALMAYSWRQFVDTRDSKWPLLFPMVKASVRAMDVVQAVTKSEFNVTVEKFTVYGASKRGWDAWLTAAVDTQRVKTVIPVVIDVLNMDKVFKNIHNSKCGWPEAMNDYVDMNVTDYVGSDSFKDLVNHIDPFVFAERLRNTNKIIINGGNDDFFWPDGSSFSYLQLPGTAKKIRYVPNTGHSMSGTDAQLTVMSVYYALLNNIELPDYTFEKIDTASGANLTVTLTKGKRPTKVLLWSCTNSNARDFRIGITGACYQSQDLTSQSTSQWSAIVATPQSGYTSFFIEMTFADYVASISSPALKFTSSAYIIPETTPCNYYPNSDVSTSDSPAYSSSHTHSSSSSDSPSSSSNNNGDLVFVLALTLALLACLFH